MGDVNVAPTDGLLPPASLGSFSASVAAGSLAWKLIDPKMFVMGSAPVSIQSQSATLYMC